MTHDKTVIQFSFVVLVNKVKRFSMSIIHEKTPVVMAGVFLITSPLPINTSATIE